MSGASPSYTAVVSKHNFSSGANSTSVGSVTNARQGPQGSSSTDYGYCTGGETGSNVIDKTDFASDGNSTDVGDLVVGSNGNGSVGCQY